MRQLFYILAFLVCFMGKAQNDALFQRATDHYNNGDYEKAIENYLNILENGQHSAALYFNLGNAYYKQNKIAPSIYYYEKALLLKPNDTEIKNNLGYAKNMTLDAIAEMPETGLSKIYGTVIGFLSFDQWAYAAVTLMVLFVILYIAFFYFKYATQKRVAFIASIISVAASILCIVFAFMQYSDFSAKRPAIVFDEEVSVMSEPNARSTEVFKLHEGTKVNVLEDLNEYNRISIPDGKKGWILKESIKLLKNF